MNAFSSATVVADGVWISDGSATIRSVAERGSNDRSQLYRRIAKGIQASCRPASVLRRSMFRSPKIVGESEEPLDLASDLTIKEKIMKKFGLVLAPIVLSIAVSSAFAGRSADQLMLQEQQNKRVVAEKRKHAEMQAMLEECMKR